MRLLPSLLILVSISLVSCTSASPAADSPATSTSNNLIVVSTVSPITSLVQNIGGTRIDLEGIVPEGTNSHTFEPAPSIAAVLSRADLIVVNGLFLEEPTIELARANQKAGSVILVLGDRALSEEEWVFDFSFPESDGHPNPHLWTAPHLALKYAEFIRDGLAGLDPDNAGYYNQNYEALADRIADLDRRIAQSVETIPPQNRRLLTYHDSFPFFGSRYGLEIIGAVQPSDFGEPSAREVANLIDQIRSTDVPAIFGSEVFPSPIMEQIARESGAEFVDQLRDDDLPGGPGDAEHTYLGLMAANLKIMAPALGGNADAFADFDSSLVFQGESRAIYPQ
jgi:ABC-type Zn uptake system ZnuABC Zn-binding protein ZnuA